MNTSTNSREDAFAKLTHLKNQFEHVSKSIFTSNEAKTRLLIIDEVLNILGWDKADFNPETSSDQGYIDYLLKADDLARVVVEAKRIGHTFAMPSFQMHETDYAVSYFRRAFGKRLTEVITQASNYANEERVPYAVISNGAEWLMIQVIPPSENTIETLRGYYFGNLLSDNWHFNLFWELLAKSSIINGGLEERFNQLNDSRSYDSHLILSEFGDFNWKKSSSKTFIREFYNRFFSNMNAPDRRKMLTKCFVSNSRIDQYQAELKRALKDTTPNYLPTETESISPKEGETLLLGEPVEHSGRVILVTGSVGCGKSTLVNKILYESKSDKHPKLLAIKIDLIDDVMPITGDITSHLFRDIRENWHQLEPKSEHLFQLRKYFGKELSILRDGPFADIYPNDPDLLKLHEAERLQELSLDDWKYFTNCWRHYKQRGFGISLIIDNVDRASEPFQKQVYSFAHKLSRLTGATIIVTMREFTFFRGQGNFLDVRSQDTVLHLESPNLEQVLSTRIKYVLSDMREDIRYRNWKRSPNWESFEAYAINHAKVLKETFLLQRSGRNILGILASISWHNVRYFFDILKRIHSQLGTTNKPWKEQEVIAAMMTTYLGNPSIITNIYRPSFENYRCYFLKVRILIYLIFGVKAGESRRGISFGRISSFARLYGYQTRWINQSITELVQERYLECLETPSTEDFTKDYVAKESHTYRASPFAIILVNKITFNPIYICLIGNDLPFQKTTVFDSYKLALQTIMDVVDNYEFERDLVDLFADTSLGVIVARYLVAIFESEQPKENIRKLQEISITEKKLNQLIEHLKLQFGIRPTLPQKKSKIKQLELFPQEDRFPTKLTDVLPIPPKIIGYKVDGSEYVPLIFWALVALKILRREHCSGTEITNIINTYLLPEHKKKFPNNVSRALRSSTLTSQEWLEITPDIQKKHKRFSLKSGWEGHWNYIFDSNVPKI